MGGQANEGDAERMGRGSENMGGYQSIGEYPKGQSLGG